MASKDAAPAAKTVVEDFLDEDQEVPGQKYVLLSFLSPESVLAKKEHFFFERFLKQYEIDWRVKNLEKFLAGTVLKINGELDAHATEIEKAGDISGAEMLRSNRIRVDNILDTYQEFVRKNQKEVNKNKIVEAWDDFMFNNREKLEYEFHSAEDFRTTVRGLKVRAVTSTTKEAELRAKKLQQKDKYHNIFIGEVGKWLPWDPAPAQVGEQQYAEERLNTLMQKYKQNEDEKEQFFEERKKGGAAAGKKIFGGAGAAVEDAASGGAAAAGGFDSMFGAAGDLALQRKMEAKKVIEVVGDEGGVAAASGGAAAESKED
jgi:hypothetical protein